MSKWEIDTDKGTIKKIEEDGGAAAIFIIIVLIAIFSGGDDKSSDSSKNTKSVAVEYWKGDPNSPIFIARDDGSMVTFKKNSARLVDNEYDGGTKLVVFRGYEVNPNGSFQEYGYYGIFFNESKGSYVVIYPKTRNFPDGTQINIKNAYQQKVCKELINSSRSYDKIKLK